MTPDAELGLADLFYFAKEVCGFRDLSVTTHKPICDKVQAYLLDGGKKPAIVIPRDHFKSSIGSAACLWMFTRKAMEGDRSFRTMIDSSTLILSQKHVTWVGNQLRRNERFRSLYGEFADRKKGARIGKRQVYVCDRNDPKKEPNFSANAIGAEITGDHFDLIWRDDIIGEKNFKTPELRQSAKDHYHAVNDLLEPGGRELYTATRWHDGDVTGMLMKKDKEAEEQEWDFYVRACRVNDNGDPDENGMPLFPERFPIPFLEKKKRNSTAFQWYSQWMNDPVQKEFSIPYEVEKLFRPRNLFPSSGLRAITVTVDPNFRDEQQTSGDYACIVIGGFDRFMDWWGIDVQMGFWTATQLIDRLFAVNATWSPHRFKIERKFTSFLEYAIRLREKESGVFMPVVWMDRDNRSKETRYTALEPVFRSNRIRFAAEIEETVKQEMQDELTRCGFSAHDDFLDALSDQFEGINPVMSAEGERPLGRPDEEPMVALTVPQAREIRYSMYGAADAGLDD